MAIKQYRVASRFQTPQSQPAPGYTQVPNSAGGYAFELDKWARLRRFLVLGTEGGSYYAGEKELTRENTQVVQDCIKEDGLRVVHELVEISKAGRAPKNDPALFALALCFADGDLATKHAAEIALPLVARIGTHLFHFAEFVSQFRGWGKLLKRAVAAWYENKDPGSLAFQAVKYRQRDGWSHRDLLRLTHPDAGLTFSTLSSGAANMQRSLVFDFMCGRESKEGTPELIRGFEVANTLPLAPEGMAKVITDYNLPREAVPTEFLKHKVVWEALLERMPLEATVRNLGNMSKCGLLTPGSAAVEQVRYRLSNVEQLRKSRLHPIKLLAALLTYGQGRGIRGSGEWDVVTPLVDALDQAYYASYGNVEPTGKRILIGLDCSGSMQSGECAGIPGLTPAVGSVANALITAAVDPQTIITEFTTSIRPSAISPRQRLDDACKSVRRVPEGTDCELPVRYAIERGLKVDAFVLYTDSETWAGNMHPVQALNEYRRKTGINAKFVTVGMLANAFTVGDTSDPLSLDVVGFDTATPQLISDFISGKF